MVEKYRLAMEKEGDSKECALCVKPVLTAFTYWKIIPNDFPYDVIAERHDMLVPIRHVTELELTPEEREEFLAIKNSDAQEYDYLIEGTYKIKSIPEHFHIHLVIGNGPQAH